MPSRLLALALAVFAGGLLLHSSRAGAQAARVPIRRGTLVYKDPRLGAKLPPREFQIFVARERLASKDYGPNVDPKFNQTYPGKLQVVCSSEEETPRSERTFVVHFLRPEDEPLARRVAAVLGRLYWIGEDYLGVGPAPGRYYNVWLARHGEPGAEEYQKNIYLFAVDQDRTPAEWVREIAHEYSHIVLPPVGEYTKPEKWASGYLGERLFLKWLLADNGVQDVWTQPIDGKALVQKEVIPLRDRYLNAGPLSDLIEDTGQEGMEYWIGQVLAIEGAHGPAVLRQLLGNYQTRRPQGLSTYFSQAISDLKPPQFTIDPALYTPAKSQVEPQQQPGMVRVKRASYWFYLPGGTWQFTLSGVLPQGTTAKLEAMELKRLPGANAWETTMPGAVGSWQRLEISAPDGQVVELQGITVAKRQ